MDRQRPSRIDELKKEEDRNQIRCICLRLDKRDKSLPASIRRENYWRNHEFLSQQIDERSHQVWMLGSLFVPVSFLIFTYTITNEFPSLLDRFLLMSGSLTCYLVFYYFYQRITLLNDLSYDYLHAYELELGLSAHLTLKKYWDASPFIRIRVNAFAGALNVLTILWTVHLFQSTITYMQSLAISLDSRTQLYELLFVACSIPVLMTLILHLVISKATDLETVRRAATEVCEQRKEEEASKS